VGCLARVGLTFDAFDESYLDYVNADEFEEEEKDGGVAEVLGVELAQPGDIIPGIVNNILTNIDPSWSLDEEEEVAAAEEELMEVVEGAGVRQLMMTHSVYEDGLEFASIGTAEDQKIRKTEKVWHSWLSLV
jgi:hypothetical protein